MRDFKDCSQEYLINRFKKNYDILFKYIDEWNNWDNKILLENFHKIFTREDIILNVFKFS